MDEAEVLRLVGDLETDRVERKESLSEPDRVAEAICAFATDLPGHKAPGVVAIGVDDGGSPVGLEVDDKLLRRLADLRDNGKIYPFPSMSVERLSLGGQPIAVVVVEPSTSPPVKFRGRTWIRVGPRRAVATPEEEARLTERRRQSAVAFDARPVPGATTADLDVARFSNELLPQLVAANILAANARSSEAQLASLQFADSSGVPTPTGCCSPGGTCWSGCREPSSSSCGWTAKTWVPRSSASTASPARSPMSSARSRRSPVPTSGSPWR